MMLHHGAGAQGTGHPGFLFLVTFVLLMLFGADVASERRHVPAKHAQAPATITPDAPDVRDTPWNLQSVFSNEMNAKERYVAFAKQADLEHYAAVANLFRACAAAEEVHAHNHVVAIAWTGGQARAVLERIDVRSTAQNLRTAIDGEQYEVEHLYPALADRARAEHRPHAVRSMTLALAAEREHVRLFTAALAGLETHPVAQAFYVCPKCGRTVELRPPHKCPACFTPAGRFIKIG
jgi:rubrerythrin